MSNNFYFFIIIYSNMIKNMLFDNYHRFIKNKLKEISNKNQLRQLQVSNRIKNSIVVNGNIKLLSFAVMIICR